MGSQLKEYTIDYGTGVTHVVEASSVQEAMEEAESQLSYTQESVYLLHGGREVARLPWHGVSPEEDNVVIAKFGNYGYYGEWQMLYLG